MLYVYTDTCRQIIASIDQKFSGLLINTASKFLVYRTDISHIPRRVIIARG